MTAIKIKRRKRNSARTSRNHLREVWSSFLVFSGKFETSWHVMSSDRCFACTNHVPSGTERAHIVPVRDGGPDSWHNIHLLCRLCHSHSEYLSNEEYWIWFLSQTPNITTSTPR